MQSSVARDRADGSEVESAPGTECQRRSKPGRPGRIRRSRGVPMPPHSTQHGNIEAFQSRSIRPRPARKRRDGVRCSDPRMAGHVPASCARGVALVHPVLNIPILRWSWVLRYDEVREVLSHDAEFPVPWTDKMKDLTSQENFVLGMPRNDTYRELPATCRGVSARRCTDVRHASGGEGD